MEYIMIMMNRTYLSLRMSEGEEKYLKNDYVTMKTSLPFIIHGDPSAGENRSDNFVAVVVVVAIRNGLECQIHIPSNKYEEWNDNEDKMTCMNRIVILHWIFGRTLLPGT